MRRRCGFAGALGHAFMLAGALGSVSCSKPPIPKTTPAPAQARHEERGDPHNVIGFEGHVVLDPRTDYASKQGDVWQYIFYQDGLPYDAMLCYPHESRCALVDLVASQDARRWTGTLSESVPSIRPFVLQYELPADRTWTSAKTVALRVESPGLGEVGSTTLRSIEAPTPPKGLYEALRGGQLLRNLYAQITDRYTERPTGEREFPASHTPYPAYPPCRPTTVDDASQLSWLGLSTGAVLTWSFEVEADPDQGSLRLIARRDANCAGEIETLVLHAKLDAFGDFARDPIEMSPRASAR